MRQFAGVHFLWPVAIADGGGPKGWSESARAIADKAKTQWVRVRADKALSAYRLELPEGKFADPTWPNMTMNEILKVAFGDRIIATDEHPIARRIRGL
jgi:hypothetical protein